LPGYRGGHSRRQPYADYCKERRDESHFRQGCEEESNGRKNQRYLILYGRKRLAIGILLGVVVKLSLDTLLMPNLPVELFSTVIGTIVPGLIANDFYRQGVVKTSLSLIFVTTVVWLTNILIKSIMVI